MNGVDVLPGPAGHLRSAVLNLKRETKLEREHLPIYDYPDVERPRTRGDCEGGPRPCPFVGCKMHLYLDVQPNGNLKLNYPTLEPWEIERSCALDIADEGGLTLQGVADAMQVTRERVRQIEGIAARKVRSMGTERARLREMAKG